MYHNDYVNAVKQYLIRYVEFSTYIENIRADIEDCRARMALDASPKVPSLSQAPGSGGDNLSQQERFYFNKSELPAKIQKMEADIAPLASRMKRLNRALEALPEADRQLITKRWIEDNSWMLVASDLRTSVGYCRKRSNKILETLAGMMWGPEAIPIQTHFVFYENGDSLIE